MLDAAAVNQCGATKMCLLCLRVCAHNCGAVEQARLCEYVRRWVQVEVVAGLYWVRRNTLSNHAFVSASKRLAPIAATLGDVLCGRARTGHQGESVSR